jgi:hypothetical protein
MFGLIPKEEKFFKLFRRRLKTSLKGAKLSRRCLMILKIRPKASAKSRISA